nr:reverse transcriptase domain-containing protein [Tanacetum cinerariifolium]
AMLRAAGPSTYILASRSETPQSRTPPLLPIPLPTSSPPLILPSTSHRVDVLEVTLPPRKRLCIALGLRFEVGESSSAPTARPTGGFRADYGFVATLDDEIRRDPERDVGYGITDTWDEILDTDEIYERLDDAQDDRLLMSGQLNMLRRDRRAHARTARLMKSEATLSRKACVQSMDASDTDRAEMAALQRRQGPARGPTHPKASEEADSSVADALATRDAERSQNGEDNHDSETGVRRQALPAHLKKKMTGKYFPRGEIKKLEVELWNLKVKGTDVVSYNQRFQELALMCTRMFPEDSDKIEMYIGGLPDMIHGSVI